MTEFSDSMFFSKFENTTRFLACTIDAIARGLSRKASGSYKATILIDAPNKHQRQDVAVRLRRRNVQLDKVRGIEDERDEFIRLADTVAGLVRATHEGKSYAQALHNRARGVGIIQEV